MTNILENYPLKRRPIFLKRVAHEAMIDQSVAYLMNGEVSVGKKTMAR
jgi:hypothetical protein